MSTELPPSPDVVFVDSLQVSANLGPDCWGRERAQPVEITVYLHLKQSYLQAAGESDDVLDSVHYGHLTKTISTMVHARSASATPAFDGADGLISAVAACAFELAGDAAEAVRVVLDVPKLILLASGFSVDATIVRGAPNEIVAKRVEVKDIVVPVIIGVNPPEREAKQRVVVNIVLYESLTAGAPVDYPALVSALFKQMETSSYLTLEKFVVQIIKFCLSFSDKLSAVTARAQKPSALSFAKYSGVEITRTRHLIMLQKKDDPRPEAGSP